MDVRWEWVLEGVEVGGQGPPLGLRAEEGGECRRGVFYIVCRDARSMAASSMVC